MSILIYCLSVIFSFFVCKKYNWLKKNNIQVTGAFSLTIAAILIFVAYYPVVTLTHFEQGALMAFSLSVGGVLDMWYSSLRGRRLKK